MTDLMVTAGDIPIAVRDFGGDGPPILMVPGGGGNVANLTELATRLRPAHRVVAMDLRGHGKSGDGPWEWDAVLGDIATVIDELRLDAPALVGQSMGGMIAALWARSHPECPGAISLDGNTPPSRPEQLVGLDPNEAAAELARLQELFASMAVAMAAPLTEEQIAALLAEARATAQQYGLAEQPRVEGIERDLLVGDGGMTRLRPGAGPVEQMRVAMERLDLDPVYRAARCPLLLVLATEDLPQQQPFHELYAAYRRYVAERVDDAARANPALRVVHLADASHAMLAEQPDQLAELITDFVTKKPATLQI